MVKKTRKDESGEPMSVRWKAMSEDDKKQKIIKAVLVLVAKYGVQGTTTARIASEVGVSEPTLYRSFRNRTSMLVAAADTIWQQRRSDIECFQAANGLERLRKLGEYHTVGIQKTRVAKFAYELAVAPPSAGLAPHLRDRQLQEVQHLVETIEAGKADGSIRADVDSYETAWRFMSVYWLESNARLHRLEDVVMSGLSTKLFERILNEIAAEPSPAGGEEPGQRQRPRTREGEEVRK